MTGQAAPEPMLRPFLLHADIPARYQRYSLDRFEYNEQIIPAVHAWLENLDSWCLYLWGDTDGRKSSLAGAILMEMRRRWADAWWERLDYGRRRHYSDHPHTIPAPGLFVPIEDAVPIIRRPTSEAYEKALDAWRGAQWLVIDDLGSHRDTPHVTETLQLLMHARYMHHDPERDTRLIVTANMDLNELARRINPATARRLDEGAVQEMKPAPQEPPND